MTCYTCLLKIFFSRISCLYHPSNPIFYHPSVNTFLNEACFISSALYHLMSPKSYIVVKLFFLGLYMSQQFKSPFNFSCYAGLFCIVSYSTFSLHIFFFMLLDRTGVVFFNIKFILQFFDDWSKSKDGKKCTVKYVCILC